MPQLLDDAGHVFSANVSIIIIVIIIIIIIIMITISLFTIAGFIALMLVGSSK